MSAILCPFALVRRRYATLRQLPTVEHRRGQAAALTMRRLCRIVVRLSPSAAEFWHDGTDKVRFSRQSRQNRRVDAKPAE
jgi:hypothetical protein